MSLTDEGLIQVPGMASRWVRLASGAKAHYMTSGDSGPPVVPLHGGLPGSSGTAGWRFTAPFLGAHGFRVYCPDQPGFGLSDTDERYRPTGVHSHVDFLQEFVDALCLDQFHLAGNSMGCTNTASYVVAHPERILSFALIAGDVGDVVPPGLRPGTKIEMTAYDGTREGMKKLMEAIIYRQAAIDPDLLEMRWMAADRQMEAHASYWPGLVQFNRLAPWQDANLAARLSTKGRLDALELPAVYLYGRQDVLTPVEWGYEQEKVLPNVQFSYVDECGHQAQTDQPDVVNRLLLEFFRDGIIQRGTAISAGVSDRRAEIATLVAT
jgi:2-hydroxy-6-oxonona-2,4-dienedioate hydrolase